MREENSLYIKVFIYVRNHFLHTEVVFLFSFIFFGIGVDVTTISKLIQIINMSFMFSFFFGIGLELSITSMLIQIINMYIRVQPTLKIIFKKVFQSTIFCKSSNYRQIIYL